MKPFSELKKIYLTEPPICYNIFKNEKPSFLVFKKELFSNPLYKNELTNYKKSEGIYYDSPEDFYYDCADLFSKFIFLESENVLEIGINHLLEKRKEFDDEER